MDGKMVWKKRIAWIEVVVMMKKNPSAIMTFTGHLLVGRKSNFMYYLAKAMKNWCIYFRFWLLYSIPKSKSMWWNWCWNCRYIKVCSSAMASTGRGLCQERGMLLWWYQWPMLWRGHQSILVCNFEQMNIMAF